VFIGIEEGVDGMVHKSDLSWTQRINNPADLYHKGDEVEAIILSINHDEKKVSLGIKQLYEDPWSYIPVQYPIGTVLEVRVISITEYGVFAEIERGVEGLIPRSEMPDDLADDPNKGFKPGENRKAEIINLDAHERKITLSLRGVEDRELDQEALKYQQEAKQQESRKVGPSGKGGATLGDVLKDKLESVMPPGQSEAEGDADADGAPEETDSES